MIENASEWINGRGRGGGESDNNTMMPLLWGTSIQGTSPSRDSKLDPEKCSYSVLSILPNQPLRNQWNYLEKMERHFSVERKFPIESSDPFTFRPKFWLLPSKAGLKTRSFGNGTASFGRSGPTGQRGPPLEVDHFNEKFPRSIYFSTEISENFGIMEITHNLTSIEGRPLFRGMGHFFLSPDTLV